MSDNVGIDRPTGALEVYITRVTNACVLIELNGFKILTDPWFRNPWGFNEEPGLAVKDLPRLNAIIGSHFAADHWGLSSMKNYKFRTSTPIFAATPKMAQRALKYGFSNAECIPWGSTRVIEPGLTLEAVEAQSFFGVRSNNYVLTVGSTRVFFGGETKELKPLRTYRTNNPKVDIALAPSNGMRLLGYQLVATANEGLEAAKILNASVFVPIHDSMHSMGFGGPTSSARELSRYDGDEPRVLFLPAGRRCRIR
ncbi:MAG: MBL fold metallo-hydrolase [Pseudomonadota bacterium]